jgi:hypothetical protein
MDTKVAQRNGEPDPGEWPDTQSEVDVIGSSNLPSTLMAIGIFALLFTAPSGCNLTLMSTMDLARVLLTLCFFAQLIPHRFTRIPLRMERLEWFFFNTFAVGPLLFCAGIWLNLLVHGEVEYRDFPRYTTLAIQDGQKLADATDDWVRYPAALDFLAPSSTDRGSVLRVGKATGLFGVEVITSKEAINPFERSGVQLP